MVGNIMIYLFPHLSHLGSGMAQAGLSCAARTHLLPVGVPEGEERRGKWYSAYYVS